MTNWKPYTYKVTHIESGKFYYGVKYGKDADPDTLFKDYFTSSKVVKLMLVNEGVNAFDYEVRRTFETAIAAQEWEERVLTKVVSWGNCLNQTISHKHYLEREAKRQAAKESKSNKKRKMHKGYVLPGQLQLEVPLGLGSISDTDWFDSPETTAAKMAQEKLYEASDIGIAYDSSIMRMSYSGSDNSHIDGYNIELEKLYDVVDALARYNHMIRRCHLVDVDFWYTNLESVHMRGSIDVMSRVSVLMKYAAVLETSHRLEILKSPDMQVLDNVHILATMNVFNTLEILKSHMDEILRYQDAITAYFPNIGKTMVHDVIADDKFDGSLQEILSELGL